MQLISQIQQSIAAATWTMASVQLYGMIYEILWLKNSRTH